MIDFNNLLGSHINAEGTKMVVISKDKTPQSPIEDGVTLLICSNSAMDIDYFTKLGAIKIPDNVETQDYLFDNYKDCYCLECDDAYNDDNSYIICTGAFGKTKAINNHNCSLFLVMDKDSYSNFDCDDDAFNYLRAIAEHLEDYVNGYVYNVYELHKSGFRLWEERYTYYSVFHSQLNEWEWE